MNKTVKFIVYGLLLLALVINILRFTRPGNSYMIDFKNVFIGSLVFTQGQNPYVNENIVIAWDKLVRQEGLAKEPAPGLPSNPFLYPPSALMLFAPLTVFSFNNASMIWMIMNILLIIGIIYIVARLGGFLHIRMEIFLLILVILSSKVVWLGLMAGQPLFFFYLFCLLSILLAMRRFPVLSGLALAIGFVKYTVAFPFVIYFIVRKKFRVLKYALLFILFMNLVMIILNPDMLTSYPELIRYTTNTGQCNDFSTLNERFFDLTTIHTIVSILIPNRTTVVWIIGILGIILVAAPFLKPKFIFLDPETAVVYFTFISLMFVPHRFIDMFMLANVFLVFKPSDLFEKLRWNSVFLIPFLFPISGLVLRFGTHLPDILQQVLMLNMQVSLTILFIIWIIQRRTVPASISV